MTAEQFDLLARLLDMGNPCRRAAHSVLFLKTAPEAAAQTQGCTPSELQEALDSLSTLALDIRGAFVLHTPADFRVTVGHHDMHRMPGALQLDIGQIVRLVAHTTERWIPVRVVTLADRPGGYYEGIIVEQLVAASRYQVGDRVRFSEDQVQTPESEVSRVRRVGWRPRRAGAW